MILTYGFCKGSAPAAGEEYQRRYSERLVANRIVFFRNFNNLRENCTLSRVRVSSEYQTVHGDERENIFQVVQLTPTTNTRRISKRRNISQSRGHYAFVNCVLVM